MKILIYGAGVVGCELAHILSRAGRHVTVLARGEWKESLEKNGLVIRHPLQLCTTVDRVNVIGALPKHEIFDLIFVVIQYGQLQEVLSDVGKNRSRHVVLVGNDPDAEGAVRILSGMDPRKEIAFGFQNTGGRREGGKVVSIHAGLGMTVGACRGHLSTEFQKRIQKTFRGTKYRLTWETDMDAWLKCHLALILPAAYVCYAVDCHLPRATKAQCKAILDAALEGCKMLRALGLSVSAAENDEYYTPGRKRRRMEIMVYIMAKTPLGRLAASDHCRAAVSEMEALDAAFERYRSETGIPMPVWDELRSLGKPGVMGAFQLEKGGGNEVL